MSNKSNFLKSATLAIAGVVVASSLSSCEMLKPKHSCKAATKEEKAKCSAAVKTEAHSCSAAKAEKAKCSSAKKASKAKEAKKAE